MATEKDAAQAKTRGQRVADSRAMEVASRVGLCARGVIYVLVGLLAVRIGFGGGSDKEADRSGAVRTIGEQSYGQVLLWALVVGLAAMALWRFSEAAFGQATEGGDKWTRRLGSLGLAVFYLVICVGVVQTALVGGSGGVRGGDESSKDYTARVLEWPYGRVLVGVFGAVLAIVGVVIVVRSLMRKFEKNLRTERMSRTTRRIVAALGIIGGVACGVVAVATGLFILLAAVRFDASEAKGLDETLRSFADTPAGPVLLIAAAVGLLMFGLYSFCEARWRKAPEHDA
ncbi:DUF1206 domain-containing protein [Streptomyces erythrochromogenes]|uniref:DUF1206 domain-containing protein n=1 Tax=Streptomyces erythrochromogenes TaxID=285574 RepID=A0ABZ1Q4K1_9ACTN|nr:DUF1206 domain-containing protein [Streptomyces erythrochromogenes]MCX5583539.1 DUF1206 domain-containing protein [Streptomyces erythrochromogenes]